MSTSEEKAAEAKRKKRKRKNKFPVKLIFLKPI